MFLKIIFSTYIPVKPYLSLSKKNIMIASPIYGIWPHCCQLFPRYFCGQLDKKNFHGRRSSKADIRSNVYKRHMFFWQSWQHCLQLVMTYDAHLHQYKSGRRYERKYAGAEGNWISLHVIFSRCSLLLVNIKGICNDDIIYYTFHKNTRVIQ